MGDSVWQLKGSDGRNGLPDLPEDVVGYVYSSQIYACNVFCTCLTSTDDIVGWWEKYFEALFNPFDTPSVEEAETVDSGVGAVAVKHTSEHLTCS